MIVLCTGGVLKKVLDVQEVSTSIGEEELIRDISFQVPAGTIMALVGHNGAGKSTLIKTIMGIHEKAKGKIIIQNSIDQDEDFLAFKKLISYLPEEPLLLTELTVTQHFQLYGMSYGLTEEDLHSKVNQFVEGFDLTDKVNEYPDSLSKGMRQKVQTICALLPNTPVLLIDEPFMGLDIYAIDFLIDLIQEKSREGTSILLTTHQLDRVKKIAHTFMMLQHGELINKGDIEQFETIQRGSST